MRNAGVSNYALLHVVRSHLVLLGNTEVDFEALPCTSIPVLLVPLVSTVSDASVSDWLCSVRQLWTVSHLLHSTHLPQRLTTSHSKLGSWSLWTCVWILVCNHVHPASIMLAWNVLLLARNTTWVLTHSLCCRQDIWFHCMPPNAHALLCHYRTSVRCGLDIQYMLINQIHVALVHSCVRRSVIMQRGVCVGGGSTVQQSVHTHLLQCTWLWSVLTGSIY